jgi:hypothetical protein
VSGALEAGIDMERRECFTDLHMEQNSFPVFYQFIGGSPKKLCCLQFYVISMTMWAMHFVTSTIIRLWDEHHTMYFSLRFSITRSTLFQPMPPMQDTNARLCIYVDADSVSFWLRVVHSCRPILALLALMPCTYSLILLSLFYLLDAP